ncbi:centrosomal protein 20-like isoform X2 [Chrysoperla carnea]|nr:centrosomal protein 20-like isoform X2 [Chrysoperla carnea]
MASEQELLEAVKEALQKDGQLGQMRAELRSAVLKILEKKPINISKPKVIEENAVINDLIFEYLEWNGYRYTSQMLLSESGQTHPAKPRRQLEEDLGIEYDSKTVQIPLIYSILAQMKANSCNSNSNSPS